MRPPLSGLLGHREAWESKKAVVPNVRVPCREEQRPGDRRFCSVPHTPLATWARSSRELGAPKVEPATPLRRPGLGWASPGPTAQGARASQG